MSDYYMRGSFRPLRHETTKRNCKQEADGKDFDATKVASATASRVALVLVASPLPWGELDADGSGRWCGFATPPLFQELGCTFWQLRRVKAFR